jgi:hypothetical protein
MPEYQKYWTELESSIGMSQSFVTHSAAASVVQSAPVSSIDSISQVHPLIRSAQGHKKDASHLIRNKIDPYPSRGFQSKVNIHVIDMVLMSRGARPVGASMQDPLPTITRQMIFIVGLGDLSKRNRSPTARPLRF